jgi:hypothetical protein
MQSDEEMNVGGSSDGACQSSEKVSSPNSSLRSLPQDAKVIELSFVDKGKRNQNETRYLIE